MVQKIQQADIFGRLGSGIGQGLADQVPKEIEHYRRSQGLKAVGEKKDLDPFQAFAELSSIYGATPQMIQTGGELLRQRAQANAYKSMEDKDIPNPPTGNASGSGIQPSPALANRSAQWKGAPYQDLAQSQRGGMPSGPPIPRPLGINNANPEQYGQPQVANVNPGNQASLPRTPWTPQQRDARTLHYLRQGFLPDQAAAKAADDESRYLAEPGAVKAQETEKVSRNQFARDELQRQLNLKLEKNKDNESKDFYKDISGVELAHLQRAMQKELIEHPEASYEDVAEDFSNRALAMAKAKNLLRTELQTNGLENLIPGRGKTTFNKLQAHQKIFKEAGNLEEFYNLLGTNPNLNLSPGGRALIAYPPSKDILNYAKNFKMPTNKFGAPYKMSEYSKKAALNVEKLLKEDDSLLSIARTFSEHNPLFDQQAFFEQLKDDYETANFNSRQKLEIAEGEKDILPTWGDILIFPWIRRVPK